MTLQAANIDGGSKAGWVLSSAHRISDVVSLVGMSMLCLSVILVICGIILRAAFGIAMPWLNDAAEIAGPVALATCFGTALLNRSMITVRLLGSVLPASLARGIEIFANSLTLALIVLVGWQLLTFGFEVWSSGRTTWSGMFLLGPAWVCLGGLMFFAGTMQALVVSGLVQRTLPVQPGADAELGEKDSLL